ncbi:MAG: hypothetical protein KGJ11_08885, partial [Candidatus Omnitrophica bacterium]|nr:hypothetical protein [Candidatus Omnitrophota bacterium]
MNNNLILIVLSAIVLISHFFNLIAKHFRIPTVLLLIGLGIGLKEGSRFLHVGIVNVSPFLGFLGIVGLILIVLEGASDLEIKSKNFPTIRRSFHTALAILLISAGVIAALFHLWLKVDIERALVNAIPFGVISSAVAIPTVADFIRHKRDFLIYESIFSDVLGILLFNLMVGPGLLSHGAVSNFFIQFGIIIITSVLGAFLLIAVLHNIKAQVKFFIILALLVLIYALAGIFNLP